MQLNDKLIKGEEGIFYNSKQTVIVFWTDSKHLIKENKLKFTHQKQNDVIISLIDDVRSESYLSQLPKARLYKIIEVLLQSDGKVGKGVLLELWGDNEPWEGWIKLTSN